MIVCDRDCDAMLQPDHARDAGAAELAACLLAAGELSPDLLASAAPDLTREQTSSARLPTFPGPLQYCLRVGEKQAMEFYFC